jgi:hypothetical protein
MEYRVEGGIRLADAVETAVLAEAAGADAIHVSALDFPEGFIIHNPPESVVVQVLAPREEGEVEEAEPGPAEPEVIGRKEEEESE